MISESDPAGSDGGLTDAREQPTRRHLHRGVAVGLLGVSLMLMWLSAQLGLGSAVVPGSGLWPFAVSVVMGVAALGMVLTMPSPADYEPFSRRSVLVLIGLASLAAYIVAFQLIGFPVPTFLLLAVWLRYLARERLSLTLIIGLGGTATLYLVFDVIFAVPFPEGAVLRLFVS